MQIEPLYFYTVHYFYIYIEMIIEEYMDEKRENIGWSSYHGTMMTKILPVV